VQQLSSTEVEFVEQVVLNGILSKSGITSVQQSLEESQMLTYLFTY